MTWKQEIKQAWQRNYCHMRTQTYALIVIAVLDLGIIAWSFEDLWF